MTMLCWKCGGIGKIYNMPTTNHESICSVCGGTGVLGDAVYHPPVKAEIARQTTSERVQDAIAKIEKIVAFDNEHGYRVNNHHSLHISDIKTALVALQAYQPWIDVGTSFPKGSFLGELSNGEIVIIKEYFEGENPFNILESPGLVFVLTDGRSVPDKNWNCVYLKRWRELPKGE